MGVRIRICPVIGFLLSCVLAFGQVRPDYFPEVTSPDSSNFEVYSQKDGLSRRANMWNLKRYFTPGINLTPLGVSVSDGDTLASNFMSFIEDSEGKVFYVNSVGITKLLSTNFSVQDTTISSSSSSYSVSFTESQEVRVLVDLSSIGSSATVELPSPDSSIGNKVTVKQINPSGAFATQVTVNAIGNRIRMPGGATLSNVIDIPAGTENEYILTPAYDDNSGVYIWSVSEPNAAYSGSSGLKFYDQVTSAEQSVKVDYEVDNVAAISALKAPNGSRITTSGYSSIGDGGSGVYVVEADSVAGYETDGIAVIQLASGNYAKLQYDGHYKIGQFNVFPANDSTTNRVNLQRAMNYVGVTGNPNILCNQLDTVKINCSTSLTFQFPKKNIHFIGLDSARTIFRVYPDNPASAFYAWNFSQTAQEVYYGVSSFSDMKVIMPPKSSDAISSFWTLQLGGGELHTLRLRVEGEGNYVVYTTGSNSATAKRVVSLKSSYFHADEDTESNTIGMFGGRAENYLLADNCIFAGAGPVAHQWYIQPWLNIHANNCQFGEGYQGGSAQCIQANQTLAGTWPTWVNTKYQIFENCTFVIGGYSALNFDKNYFPFLTIKNCSFLNEGDKLSIKNNAIISDMISYSVGPHTFNVDGGEGLINISNSIFKNGGKLRIIGGSSSKEIFANVSNCTFYNVQGNFETRLVYAADTVRANWNVSNCSFVNTGNSASSPFYYSEIAQYAASVNVNDSYLEGHTIFLGSNSSQYELRINGGEWRPAGGRLYNNLSESGETPGFGIEIRNLKIKGYSQTPIEDRNDDTTAARIKWFFPQFEWPRDIDIQSDNTVDSINIGHGIYRITDTGNRDSIVTLGLYAEAEPGTPVSSFTYDSSWKKYVSGRVKLIASDEFTLGNSGNINIPLPYTVKQGRYVELEFTRSDMKWQCLNCFNQTQNLFGSATLDFANTAAQTSADLTITVSGAEEGDEVVLGVPSASVNANTMFSARVSAADTVTVTFNNYSSGAVDPSSGTFKATVIKQ